MTTNDLKSKVIAALKADSQNFSSAAKHAVSLGINTGIYSRIMAGETDRVLADAAWISLARKLDVQLRNMPVWRTAETPVYVFITEQLKKCQDDAISCIICDDADIGKTYTARAYVKSNANAIYIDCSQVKSKQKLVRQIAKEFGIDSKGKYAEVYNDLTYYLNSLENPLIILDEAGDLLYDAFLELKALWNATERNCGWCMMGADGLKQKIERAIDNKKVGYTELLSRFGKRFQRVTPLGKEDYKSFSIAQAGLIIKANNPNADLQKLIAKTDSSLRRIYHELSKIKA